MKPIFFILPLLLFFLSHCSQSSTTIVSVDLVGSLQPHEGIPALPLARGATQKFQAIANYDDKHWENQSKAAVWSINLICPSASDPGSSGEAFATISNDGVVTGINGGSIFVVATVGSTIGCFALTISGSPLVSIEVNPAILTAPAGYSQAFTALGIYEDGSTADLTGSAVWTSSLTNVADVLNTTGQKGVAVGASPGVTTIKATVGNISGTAEFTVTSAVLVSIAVTPTNPSIPLGLSQQFIATGTYSDQTTQNLTNSVTWTSDDPAVATIDIHGVANSVSIGSSTIRATLGGITDSSILSVTTATLDQITLSPLNSTTPLGVNVQFSATGHYTDGSTQDLTSTVVWTSSNPAVATVSNSGTNGLSHPVSLGSTFISAQTNGILSATQLTVSSAELVSIDVTPTNPSIAKGLTQQFIATGNYTDGSTQVITNSVLWSSSNAGIATVTNAAGARGRATGVSPGTVTITATSGAISNHTDLTVTIAVLQSLSVSPQSSSFSQGHTKQYSVIGTYSDNSTADLTTTVTWTSSSPATATISNAGGSEGLATGVSIGFVRFTATLGPIRASANATISP